MKTMRETSWRTLMLMTTVLILVIIFEGTVRPRKPKTPLIGPTMGAPRATDPNQAQRSSPTGLVASEVVDQPIPSRPQPVVQVVPARLTWINNELVDLTKMGWASPDESDDPNGAAASIVE